MNRYAIIAFTHHSTGLNNLDGFFVDDAILTQRLQEIKTGLNADGVMYLATCNRLEFIFSLSAPAKEDFAKDFVHLFHPEWTEQEVKWGLGNALVLFGESAVKHLIEVASSLDSLIVGEREIITQVRQAYEWSNERKLTDDYIRILVRKTIETAKKVYTDTKIADKPVSVMSLACRKLQQWNVDLHSRILMVGAGQTADVMVKYMSKHGFKNFSVFNRTLENAQVLANRYGIEAYSLEQLATYDKGFDVLITCVQSAKPIISAELFDKLAKDETPSKMVVDLGLPFNVDKKVLLKPNVKAINVESLNEVAEKNLEERKAEMFEANAIITEAVREFYGDIKSRKIEVALGEVPERIREIKERAISSVFSKEIESLSPESKELMEKMMDYMEKKCVSIPMQVAKEKFLDFEA